jgi:alpha-glucuronidase
MIMGRGLVNRLLALILAVAALALPCAAQAEDGYDLWLRYAPLEGKALARVRALPLVVHAGQDPTVALAGAELMRGLARLRGESGRTGVVITAARLDRPLPPGSLSLDCHVASVPSGGAFSIKPVNGGLRVAAGEPIGCLYGAYALLRELSLGRDPGTIDLDERPAMPLRMLDHWDNPDGTVERG